MGIYIIQMTSVQSSSYAKFVSTTSPCTTCDQTGRITCKDCTGDGQLVAGRGSGSKVSQSSVDLYIAKHSKCPPCRSCGGIGTIPHGGCHGTGIATTSYYTSSD
jgi:hypothetical protein